MSAKRNRIIYLVATGLITALMLMSAGMYFVNHTGVSKIFTELGYPSYLVYPLAIAKILGLIAIWTKKSNTLTEWAYAGFFFDFVLAFSAHIHAQDGAHWTALVAIVLLLVSYFFGGRTQSA